MLPNVDLDVPWNACLGRATVCIKRINIIPYR